MVLPILVGLIAVALLFDFLNGLHDAANSIATIVSTRVLRPQYAVIWAAFFNFVAFWFSGCNVAQTIGVGIIDPSVDRRSGDLRRPDGRDRLEPNHLGLGIPSSSSHALIGGLVGAGIAKAGLAAVVWGGLIKTAAGDRAVAGARLRARAGAGGDRLVGCRCARRRLRSTALSGPCSSLSASLYSLGHGGNDAQKTMGIIAVLLYSQGDLGANFCVPFWVVIPARRPWRSAP